MACTTSPARATSADRSASSRPIISASSAMSASPPTSIRAAATLFFLLTNKYPYLGFDPQEPGSYEIILQHPPVPFAPFGPTLRRAWNAHCSRPCKNSRATAGNRPRPWPTPSPIRLAVFVVTFSGTAT